jgi:hypothetical protein
MAAASYRNKFVAFCAATDCTARRQFPLFPLDLSKLMTFCIWLSDNGVNGWNSARIYVSACCSWHSERGFDDVRETTPVHKALYARFRLRFQSDIPNKKLRLPKMAIRPELMEAMALQTRVYDKQSLGEMASYCLLFFSSIRIGHVAPSTRAMAKHCLLWQDVIITDTEVFIYLRSTKTRSAASQDCWWTALAARPQGHLLLDPVRCLRLWHSRSFRTGMQPVFPDRTADMLVQTRTAFTTCLRRRLRQATTILPNGHLCDCDRMSGISFRMSGIVQLWDRIPRHRISAQAGHASFSSTNVYGGDTIDVRRTNTAHIAANFGSGF